MSVSITECAGHLIVETRIIRVFVERRAAGGDRCICIDIGLFHAGANAFRIARMRCKTVALGDIPIPVIAAVSSDFVNRCVGEGRTST